MQQVHTSSHTCTKINNSNTVSLMICVILTSRHPAGLINLALIKQIPSSVDEVDVFSLAFYLCLGKKWIVILRWFTNATAIPQACC